MLAVVNGWVARAFMRAGMGGWNASLGVRTWSSASIAFLPGADLTLRKQASDRRHAFVVPLACQRPAAMHHISAPCLAPQPRQVVLDVVE